MQRAERGLWHGGPFTPFGYRYVPSSTGRGLDLVVDDARAKLVREACRRVVRGDSLMGIAKDWNARGLVTTTGAPWRAIGIRKMLVRPSTAGLAERRGQFYPGMWPARAALALVHTLADEFAAEVKELCALTVSDRQWAAFLDVQVRVLDHQQQPLTGRSLTTAHKKRSRLENLYLHDNRVSPWAGTAFGALQAVNTYEHHDSAVRGADRADRNMLRAVTGEFARLDRDSWASLSTVLAGAN